MKKGISMLVAALLAVVLWASAMAAVPTAQELEPMLPALDSVLRAVDVEDQGSYDAGNPEFVWSVLYMMGVNFGTVSPDVVYDEPIVVPESVMAQFAKAAFADLAALPEIPEALSYSVQHDEAQGAYLLAGSDAGDSSTQIEGIISSADGPLGVAVAMYGGDGERLSGLTANLVPSDDPLFPYSIQSVTMG